MDDFKIKNGGIGRGPRHPDTLEKIEADGGGRKPELIVVKGILRVSVVHISEAEVRIAAGEIVAVVAVIRIRPLGNKHVRDRRTSRRPRRSLVDETDPLELDIAK